MRVRARLRPPPTPPSPAHRMSTIFFFLFACLLVCAPTRALVYIHGHAPQPAKKDNLPKYDPPIGRMLALLSYTKQNKKKERNTYRARSHDVVVCVRACVALGKMASWRAAL